MKLPYIKVYASDVLAASRNLTTQQIGDAILGICEQAFEGDTAYLPETTREQAFFALLESWKAQAEQGAKHRKQVAKKASREARLLAKCLENLHSTLHGAVRVVMLMLAPAAEANDTMGLHVGQKPCHNCRLINGIERICILV